MENKDESLDKKGTEFEKYLKQRKKEFEKKQKENKNAHIKMKENYYAYHSDIKTSARDNGEW